MGVGSDFYMYDVVVKRSRSLSHLLMSSCSSNLKTNTEIPLTQHKVYSTKEMSKSECCCSILCRIKKCRQQRRSNWTRTQWYDVRKCTKSFRT